MRSTTGQDRAGRRCWLRWALAGAAAAALLGAALWLCVAALPHLHLSAAADRLWVPSHSSDQELVDGPKQARDRVPSGGTGGAGHDRPVLG
jgi:hypothetical protein